MKRIKWINYRVLLTVMLAAVLLTFAARQVGAPQPPAEKRLIVVATIFPLADWLREICGPDAEVLCLVSGGTSAHHFDPSTHDALRVTQARALFAVGLGLDAWAAKLVENAGRGEQLAYFETGDWIEHIKIGALKIIPVAGGDEDEPHRPGTDDPHYWLDPARANAVVARMAQELGKLDPAHREGFSRRAAAYREKLQALDGELKEKAKAIPAGAQLVTFHEAYGYLLERLKIKLAAVVQVSPGVEPSIKDVAEALRVMRELKQAVVFQEPQESAAAAKVVAKELNAKLEELDPMECEASGVGKTYLERARHNINAIAGAVSAK